MNTQEIDQRIVRLFRVPTVVLSSSRRKSLADELIEKGLAQDSRGRIDRRTATRIYEMFGDQ